MAIIKNIRQLKAAAVLAERKATTTSLDFKKVNLLYGFNGSGKSTLSRVFASLQQGQRHGRLPDACTFEIEMDNGTKYTCPKSLAGIEKRVCVFNHDFIAENQHEHIDGLRSTSPNPARRRAAAGGAEEVPPEDAVDPGPVLDAAGGETPPDEL